MKALKWSVRYLLDHSPSLTIPERWAVEQELKKLKRRAPKVGIAKADRVPTADELKILEEKADPRLSLMIKFLEATSCRVSEMLHAELGKARRGARITYLEIAGKKGKTRDLRLPTPLYDAIRARVQRDQPSCLNMLAMGTAASPSATASESCRPGRSARK